MCTQCKLSRRAFLRTAGMTITGVALAACGTQGGESVSTNHSEVHWGYTSDAGPDHWGDLKPEYELCRIGRKQSPVDITGAMPDGMLQPAMINYQNTPVTLVNNGHTIQVNYAPGSTLLFDGQSYELAQFHFHHPSEHTIDGKPFVMELHLVHRNTAGNLAVVGVLLTEGTENPVLAQFWDRLPAQEGELPLDKSVNIASLLPIDGHYYTYMGSLTTPPCSEEVRWIVMKTPVEVSASQVAMFAAIFQGNARPVQQLNGRPIEEF